MNFININEKRPEYSFLDAKCIGRRCWHPVNLGDKQCCSNRMHRGCPEPLPEFDKAARERRVGLGWRTA